MTSTARFLTELVCQGPANWTNKLLLPRRADGTIIAMEDRASADLASNGFLITCRGRSVFSLVGLMKTKCGTGTRFAITFDTATDSCTGELYVDNLAGEVYVNRPSDATGVKGIDYEYDIAFKMVRYMSNTTNYDHWLKTCHAMINVCASTTPKTIIWDNIDVTSLADCCGRDLSDPEFVARIEAKEDKENIIITDFVKANNADCDYFKVLRPRRRDGSVLEDLQAPADIAQCGLIIEKLSLGSKVSFIGSDNGVVDLIAQFHLHDNNDDGLVFIRGGEFFVSDVSGVTGTAGIDYMVSERKNGFYYCSHGFTEHNTSSTLELPHWARTAMDVLLACIASMPSDPIQWDSTGSVETNNVVDMEAIYDILQMSASLNSGYMRSPLRTQITATRMEAARIASDKAADELLMEEAEEASRIAEKKSKKSKKNAKSKARQKDKEQTKRLTDILLGIKLTDEPKIIDVHAVPGRVAYNPLNIVYNPLNVAPPAAPPTATPAAPETTETVYEDDESDSECDFCMERPRTSIAFPCKHANMCSVCVHAQIEAKKFDCIKCRCPLDGFWLQDEGRTVECIVA